MYIQKETAANAIGTAKEVVGVINKLRYEIDSEIALTIVKNDADYINKAIYSLCEALVIGAILLAGILFLFMKNIRNVIIVATTLPLSLLISVLLMYFTKQTFNVMTLSGLAMGMANVMDNAIVVIENISFRHHRRTRKTKHILKSRDSEFMDAGDENTFRIGIQFPPATRIEISNEIVKKMETKLMSFKELSAERRKWRGYNGSENISVGIYQQSGSNLINLSKEVRKKLKDIKEKIQEDVDIKITSDQSEFIKESLLNLYSNGIQGILLSFILLYFFMKSFMASTIINIAIPVALCGTLSLMYFGDISLNTMSLGGLTVGIGMVVDNSKCSS